MGNVFEKIWWTFQALLNWLVWIVFCYILVIATLNSSTASLVNGAEEFILGFTGVVFILQMYGLFWIWSGIESKYARFSKTFVNAPSLGVFIFFILMFVFISILMIAQKVIG